MEHDSSRSGYHEPEPGLAGREDEEDWGDDFPKTFSVNLIWAQACDKEGHDGAIGFEGGMPWHLPEEMRHFTELTVSHPVIMGRKTWESLGRPLPGRENVVVTRRELSFDGARTVHSLDEAYALFPPEEEVFVIGGAQIYGEALPAADRFYLTRVHRAYEGDTRFPEWDAAEWRLVGSESVPCGERYEYPFTFETYERKR